MAAAKRRFIATVKTHILNILEKTGFRNRTELAVRARKSCLVILKRKTEHYKCNAFILRDNMIFYQIPANACGRNLFYIRL